LRLGPNVQVGSGYNHDWMLTDLDDGSDWQGKYVSAYCLSRWGNDEARTTAAPSCPTARNARRSPTAATYLA